MERKTLINNFLNNINFKYTTALDQSNTFTKQHKRYKCTLKRVDNGMSITTDYQCNPSYVKITKENVLQCLFFDAQCYENCDDDIQCFADSLGYTNIKETLEVFSECKETYNKLILFCGGEIAYNSLKEYFNEL